jgi:WD40 repeat protein
VFEFGPDKQGLFVAEYNVISLLDYETGYLKCALRGHVQEVRSIAFSRFGTYYLTSSKDMVILWTKSTDEFTKVYSWSRGSKNCAGTSFLKFIRLQY